MAICMLWVLVYGLMLVTSLSQGQPLTLKSVLLGTGGGHRFGAMSLAELMRGELWRTLTATFVHYGIVHLAMNLFGMYQLGSLVEEWYGRAQALAIYVAIAIGGNLLSGLFRYEAASNRYIQSAGGSTVVLGLVALCAVVGWRSRTRVGSYLSKEMLRVLLLTALLGLIPIIDNWGHAGGALVGGAIGFGHRFLIQNAGRPLARWAGGIAAAVLVTCAGAQVRADRLDAPARAGQRLASQQDTLLRLAQVEREYVRAFTPLKTPQGYLMPRESRGAAQLAMTHLELLEGRLDRPPMRDDYRRLKVLIPEVRLGPPSESSAREFKAIMTRLGRQLARERDAALSEFQALRASRMRR
jgi:rhomboid protease GluP